MDRAFQNRWSGDLVQDLVARMHPTIALAQQLLPLRYLYPFPHTTLSLQKAAALHALSLWIHQQCSRSSVTSVPPWPCTSRWVRRAAKRAGCTAQMARSSGGAGWRMTVLAMVLLHFPWCLFPCSSSPIKSMKLLCVLWARPPLWSIRVLMHVVLHNIHQGFAAFEKIGGWDLCIEEMQINFS
jgi:hypothetical protein